MYAIQSTTSFNTSKLTHLSAQLDRKNSVRIAVRTYLRVFLLSVCVFISYEVHTMVIARSDAKQ